MKLLITRMSTLTVYLLVPRMFFSIFSFILRPVHCRLHYYEHRQYYVTSVSTLSCLERHNDEQYPGAQLVYCNVFLLLLLLLFFFFFLFLGWTAIKCNGWGSRSRPLMKRKKKKKSIKSIQNKTKQISQPTRY